MPSPDFINRKAFIFKFKYSEITLATISIRIEQLKPRPC